jgi:hypothetical protein
MGIAGNVSKGYAHPFYVNGRSLLGIYPKRIDELITAGASAWLAGDVVTITVGSRVETYKVPKHLHRHAVARWVNSFNERAAGRVGDE